MKNIYSHYTRILTTAVIHTTVMINIMITAMIHTTVMINIMTTAMIQYHCNDKYYDNCYDTASL